MEQLPPRDYIRLFHSCVTLLTLTRLLRGRGQRESALVFLPYPAAGVTALFTCFTAGYSLGSCFVNGNGVDLRGVSPNSRKIVLARSNSIVQGEVTLPGNSTRSNLDEKRAVQTFALSEQLLTKCISICYNKNVQLKKGAEFSI